MFRIAKPQRYMLLSPTRDQVASQNAMEVQPLILEPRSRMYTSPVVVLDFQSLYPSVVRPCDVCVGTHLQSPHWFGRCPHFVSSQMIAYNMCFSTCLGRLEHSEVGLFAAGLCFVSLVTLLPPCCPRRRFGHGWA